MSKPSFFAELQRRKVFKVGAAYLVVAWLLIQVVATLAPQMRLPDWVPRSITLVLLVGFPIALVMAWLFDVTPEGVVRDPEDAAPTPKPTAEPVQLAVPHKSIAVLAFADLSPTHDQEFFSDGMAEEILNALAKVRDLKVAGRTSSFFYKGRNEDLRSVGKALGVAHVLEGSVRKQGEKVRITAQLVQADDGFHVWSETYDGDMDDVFELQERIARAITHELEVVLHGDQQHSLITVATSNPEAYALYLQASSIFNRREGARFADAIAMLEQALQLDPAFARAHARLASMLAISPIYAPASFRKAVAAAEMHARTAIEQDPKLAEPHAALGLLFVIVRRMCEGRASLERALALDPLDANVNSWFGNALASSGYITLANQAFDHVLEIDPMLPNALNWRGMTHLYAGEMEIAERQLLRAADTGLAHVGIGISALEEARGRREEAVRNLVPACRVFLGNLPVGSETTIASGILGDGAARAGTGRDRRLPRQRTSYRLWPRDVGTGATRAARTGAGSGAGSPDHQRHAAAVLHRLESAGARDPAASGVRGVRTKDRFEGALGSLRPARWLPPQRDRRLHP